MKDGPDPDLEPFLGHLLLHRLTKENLRAYRLHLERRGQLSPQSVKPLLSDARCLLNWREDAGLVDRSPFPRRIMPRLAEALASLPNPFGLAIRLGLGTGLRWGELERLQASDIQHGELVVSQTKTGKVRRVPLSEQLRSELKTRVGKLIPFTDQQWLTDYCRRETGIKRFHVHMLRHTSACQWLERGGSVPVLQEILGHSSIVTTQRYARVSHDLVRREVARLEGRGDAKVVADPLL